MTELVLEFTEPGKITFNFDQLKAEIEEKARTYELAQYTEDTVKLAKEDRATLNRLKKALNDERIRREKEFLAPFQTFKSQINELIAIIDRPVSIIDTQVKSFEETQKRQKADYIKAWFTANRVLLAAPVWLELDRIARPNWTNASAKVKDIQGELSEICRKINADIETLAALPEYSFEAQEEYKRTLDLNAAIAAGKRMAEIQRRKAELEAARKAEEERRKAEEEARKAQLEALKAAESAKSPEVEQIPTQEEKTAPAAAQSHTEPKEAEPAALWVTFQALLTREQALELRDYFRERGIQIRKPQ